MKDRHCEEWSDAAVWPGTGSVRFFCASCDRTISDLNLRFWPLTFSLSFRSLLFARDDVPPPAVSEESKTTLPAETKPEFEDVDK